VLLKRGQGQYGGDAHVFRGERYRYKMPVSDYLRIAREAS
jgi:hypothetical protein